MKTSFQQRTRLRFVAFFRWQRLLGLAGVALAGYLLLFVVLGHTDVSWLLPAGSPSRFHWPDLPHFLVWKETAPNGAQETIYSVPSRQLTARELDQLGGTNSAPAATNSK